MEPFHIALLQLRVELALSFYLERIEIESPYSFV